MNSRWCVRYETRLFLTFSTILISNYFNIFFCHSLRYCQLGPKYLLWLLINETVLIREKQYRCVCGHGDMRTGPHKVLAATLTLLKPGRYRLRPPYADVPTKFWKPQARLILVIKCHLSWFSLFFLFSNRGVHNAKKPWSISHCVFSSITYVQCTLHMLPSMTPLLTHTVAHSTRPSFA